MHFKSSRSLPRRILVAWIAGIMLGAAVASACSIPVFRYALERWESDRLQVIVYHAGQLATQEDEAVRRLVERSAVTGGPLNIEVIQYDVSGAPPKLLDVEPPTAGNALPLLEVRARTDGAGWSRRWQGPLASAVTQPGLFDSPAREEVVRRILSGDSAVWLLIAPDAEQGRSLEKSLQESLNTVAMNLPPPQGIGQPGSELYASVPLELRFSVLTISHSDPAEQRFLEMLAASAKEWQTDAAYAVPVFGRCRALDVIPYPELDSATVEEIAGFICGACSCQVKQANPGFDLLVAVNWEEKLFGAMIPESAGIATTSIESSLDKSGVDQSTSGAAADFIAIPPGNETTTAAVAADRELAAASDVTAPTESTSSNKGIGIIFLAVAIATFVGIRRLRRKR